ncbi:MAG: anti-sigma factor [Alphaproteobacteria bacterium]|nr:anti-sigma factor [Alphaproteobacteria bacterium]
MMKTDDIMLMAYVDGEVDAVTARELETAIAGDPTLRARVAMFRESASLTRGAFTEVLHEPIPDRLLAAIHNPAAVVAAKTPPPAEPNVVPLRRPARPSAISSSWRTAGWAAAAAIAAVTIFAAGQKTGFVRLEASAPPIQRASVSPDSERWLENLAGYFREYDVTLQREQRLLVDFGAEHIAELEKWFGARLNRQIAVPDLTPFGYRAEGGRFVVVAGKPAAQFLYLSEKKELIQLVVAMTDLPERGGRLDKRGDVNIVHWRENGYAYAFVGRVDGDRLWRMADVTWVKLKPV